VADYVSCMGAIGRFLLRRGRISVALDANDTGKGQPFRTWAVDQLE
jgi:hypothetical protein